jgi:hypothetical protein
MSKSSKSAAQRAAGGKVAAVLNPWPHLIPPIGTVAVLILSGVMSLHWGPHAGPVPAWQTVLRLLIFLLCSAGVLAVTWFAGLPRAAVLRGVSLSLAALLCLWMIVLTFHGWTVPLVGVYLLTSLTSCLCLSIVRMLRGDGRDDAKGGGSPFGAVVEAVAELRNVARISKPKVIDGVVTTEVRMEPGVEVADLRKATGAIATLVPTDPANVRVVPTPNDPGHGKLEVTATDLLATPPNWPGLSAPGKSIALPLNLCVYGSGRVPEVLLFGDPNRGINAIGLLVIAGQPGAGKTELVLGMSAEILSRDDANLTVIDARKGEQLPAWLTDGAKVITTEKAGEQIVAGLVDQVPVRAGILGRAGFRSWREGCPLRAEVVILDEAARLIADRGEKELVELAESVRSVGILLVLVMQRVTTDRMPSSVKKARGGSICMGVADQAEAGRILSSETIEAGANPGDVKNAQPGALWMELPSIPSADWSRKMRTYRPPAEDVLAAAVAPHIAAGQPAASTSVVAPRQAEPVKTFNDNDVERLDPTDDDPEARREIEDPEMPLIEAGDRRAPITVPNRPRIDLRTPEETWTKTELLRLLRKTIADFRTGGKNTLRPADFGPLAAEIGPDNLKAPKLSGYLKELCQPGPGRLLRKSSDKGVYYIEPQDHTAPVT